MADTWCAKFEDCGEIVDLDKQPVNDRNGEALCAGHGEEELARK
jgi:hypothetical protein